MTEIDNGGQAYPAAWGNPEQGGDYVPGMTLRDWFAGQALAGLMAGGMGCCSDTIADDPYRIADAMLAARKTLVKEKFND